MLPLDGRIVTAGGRSTSGLIVWRPAQEAATAAPPASGQIASKTIESASDGAEQADGEGASSKPGVWVYDEVLPTSMVKDLQAAVQTSLWHRQFGQLWLELPIRQEAAQMDMMQSVFSYLLATVPPLKAEAWEVLEFFQHNRHQDQPFQTHFDAA